MQTKPRVALGIILAVLHIGAMQTLWGAVGSFIPAANRVDMVHDAGRDLLYISSGAEVLRYSLSSNSFVPSYALGGSLYGMDLSPDGNLLAVADQAAPVNGSNQVHVVDLRTGTDKPVFFAVGFGESGTYTVAFCADGSLLITSSYAGSGWAALRRYDPQTGLTKVIAQPRQDTMLTASTVYLEDGRIEIDQNLVENAIRPTAIGKKNWLFVGEAGAGQRGAILYSVIESCRRRGIDPMAYLRDVLSRLPSMTNHQIGHITPANWLKSHQLAGQLAA